MLQLIILKDKFKVDANLSEVTKDTLIIPDKLFLLAILPENQHIRNMLFSLRNKKTDTFVKVTRLGHQVKDKFYLKEITANTESVLNLDIKERSFGVYAK